MMNNQKLENLLNLALEMPEEMRIIDCEAWSGRAIGFSKDNGNHEGDYIFNP